MGKSKEDINGAWFYVIPIHGLQISKEINEEFKLLKVTFISSNKLKNTKTRFYFSFQNSLIYGRLNDFFENHKCFAILQHYGNPSEQESECRKIINNEINILLSSFIGDRDYFYNRISLANTEVHININKRIIINKEQKTNPLPFVNYIQMRPFILDRRWKDYNKQRFLFNLIKINNNDSINNNWKHTLKRAAELIGQANNSNILSFCFLNNMIAFEMLLKKEGKNMNKLCLKE